MATTPADQRTMLLAAALFVAALAIFAVRSLKAGSAIAMRAVPTADLQTLSSFLMPLGSSSLLATSPAGTIVVARDPFVAKAVAAEQGPLRTTANPVQPTTAKSQPWVVSSILVEGSRRSAIVNDVWVTVGDSLGGGSHLTAVEPDHIVVTDAKGIRHTVPIQGGESW